MVNRRLSLAGGDACAWPGTSASQTAPQPHAVIIYIGGARNCTRDHLVSLFSAAFTKYAVPLF